ncbi:MAG: hypothetical protein LBJ18_03030 [Rickettsiales bacterium]|jgi:hypothetical protein|nr:hypothetical protein [Rickettsiales bacterium]
MKKKLKIYILTALAVAIATACGQRHEKSAEKEADTKKQKIEAAKSKLSEAQADSVFNIDFRMLADSIKQLTAYTDGLGAEIAALSEDDFNFDSYVCKQSYGKLESGLSKIDKKYIHERLKRLDPNRHIMIADYDGSGTMNKYEYVEKFDYDMYMAFIISIQELDEKSLTPKDIDLLSKFKATYDKIYASISIDGSKLGPLKQAAKIREKKIGEAQPYRESLQKLTTRKSEIISKLKGRNY